MVLNVVYYFYWHLNPKFPAKEIMKAIQEKNYETFMAYYNQWLRTGLAQNVTYLPSEAYVSVGEDYEHIVTTNILEKNNFMQITHCEYECG